MQPMKRLMLILVLTVGGIGLSSSVALASSKPSTIVGKACDEVPSLPGCDASDQKLDSNPGAGEFSYLEEFLNVLFLAAGLTAVVFVILGGVRYITSTGDPTRIESAKTTILYAVIGLIVTVLAVPISAFLINASGG